jgi:hypothetical protein
VATVGLDEGVVDVWLVHGRRTDRGGLQARLPAEPELLIPGLKTELS